MRSGGQVSTSQLNNFDSKIEAEIEAHLRALEIEKAKWSRILRVMRGVKSVETGSNGSVDNDRRTELKFTEDLGPKPIANAELVRSALDTLKGRAFDVELVFKTVRDLPFPEAKRITRQQVRTAF